MGVELGSIGVWRQGPLLSPDLAAELEKLGYGTIWVGSSPPGDLRLIEDLLAATDRITVATSIVNIWKDDAAEVADSYHRVADRYGERFLLGIGAGHPERTSRYASPYQAMVDYLDTLDAAAVPAHRRVLAALGPTVLRLAADRAAGAIPYLVPVEHTRRAREILGPGVLLAPEQKVVLEPDPDRARRIGRQHVQNPYLGLVNYTRNLLSLGYTEADIADGGSDRLIDDLALHGTPDAVARGIAGHLEAGADHVAVQLLTDPGGDLVAEYRALADALPG